MSVTKAYVICAEGDETIPLPDVLINSDFYKAAFKRKVADIAFLEVDFPCDVVDLALSFMEYADTELSGTPVPLEMLVQFADQYKLVDLYQEAMRLLVNKTTNLSELFQLVSELYYNIQPMQDM